MTPTTNRLLCTLSALALTTGTAAAVDQAAIEEQMIANVLRSADPDKIRTMMPDLDALAEEFDPAASQLVETESDFRALVSYAKAVLAKADGDEPGIRKHITDAFWLAPEQAQFFANFAASHQSEKAMESLTVNLEVLLKTADGTETNLAKLMDGKKAVLLDFWASWCGPCVQLMPALAEKAAHLAAHDIVVASVNTDEQNPMEETKTMRGKHEFPDSMPWLLDSTDDSYQSVFQINSIPRMVLISPEGKVLYNGHPQDPSLWGALQKISSDITPPEDV